MTKEKGNLMVPTANRPYQALPNLPSVGFKPMHSMAKPQVWSAVIRIKAGEMLPGRRHTGLCEMLVVRGSGNYMAGQQFGGGDYLREVAGDYEQIKSHDDLVLFVTHHGSCSFLDQDRSPVFELNYRTVAETL